MAALAGISSYNLSNPNFNLFINQLPPNRSSSRFGAQFRTLSRRRPLIFNESRTNSNLRSNFEQEEEVKDPGVKAALSMLKFYKREISPILPKSCRFVPTCSEYSMEAYKKYGVVKGTVLTAWRLCRCNPFGGSGFDPPRWFGEKSLPQE